MKFKVSKKEMLKALKQVMPSDYIIISADPNDSKICLTSFGELQTKTFVDAEVAESGTTGMSFAFLQQITSKIDTEDMFSVKTGNDNKIHFKGTCSTYKIATVNSDSLPQVDFSTPADEFRLTKKELLEVISQVAYACSEKQIAKPVLYGVNFVFTPSVMVAVATDSYRLAKKEIHAGFGASGSVTVPFKMLSYAKKALLPEYEDDDTVTIAYSNRKIVMIGKNSVIQSPLLYGNYPAVKNLIPSEHISELVINRSKFIKTLERSMFIKVDNLSIATFNSEDMNFNSRSQEIGDFNEALTGTYSGESLKISFSCKYMLDALKALNGEFVRIYFTGQYRPMLITDPDDDSQLHLVLPTRTYD